MSSFFGFSKYQGAGNDFIMVDQRQHQWIDPADSQRIAALCHRRFGIGADGLILLRSAEGFDFEMVYFNADGAEGSLCGNGGRCTVAFAKHLGIIERECTFLASDGPHQARIMQPTETGGEWIELQMADVPEIRQTDSGAYVLDTGSPHYVEFLKADHQTLVELDVFGKGRAIRNSEPYQTKGINVNFVVGDNQGLYIRTYERGVEDETLACGTGITAAALAFYRHANTGTGAVEIPVHASGGDLSVRFRADENGNFSNIWLCGPAQRVFTGQIEP